ncbi:MAG: LCP family protein [Actinomycetota bacterium]|nr:LCP family protein [Actinomycetota bacterium]
MVRGAARTVVTLLSVAVLGVAGVSWAGLVSIERTLATTDVLVAPPPSLAGEDGDGATDILLIGSDSRTDAQGNPLPLDVLRLLRTEESVGTNTDTIILIRVPDSGAAAHAVSIPRDTYVPIPGYREDKINAAYGEVAVRTADDLRDRGVTDSDRIQRESDRAGRRALVESVQNLTGVQVDHYAEVNLFGFYLLTEAVGGVEVCLNSATSDSGSGADFAAGRQTISGADALAFVRQRGDLPRGDLDRIVRQQVFMAAAVGKVLSTGTLTDPGRLRALVAAAQRSVVLDEGWDVLDFATQLQGIAAGAVEFVTIPLQSVGARNERGQSIITVDPPQVQRFVAGLLDGTADAAAPLATVAPAPSTADSAAPRYVVEVRNGTGTDGLASQVAGELADAGFAAGDVIDTAARAGTVIEVAPGQGAAGERIATLLGGGIPVQADPALAQDRIVVLLGEDYTGPDQQGVAAPAVLRPGGATATTQPASTQPARFQADPPPPITADGVPCVN